MSQGYNVKAKKVYNDSGELVPGGGSFVGAKIYIAGPQTGFGGIGQVTFTGANAQYDVGSLVGTNQFVIPSTGYYQIKGWCYAPTNSSAEFVLMYYKINAGGVVGFTGLATGTSGAYTSTAGSVDLSLTASDTVEIHIYSSTPTGSPADAAGGITFSIHKIG